MLNNKLYSLKQGVRHPLNNYNHSYIYNYKMSYNYI